MTKRNAIMGPQVGSDRLAFSTLMEGESPPPRKEKSRQHSHQHVPWVTELRMSQTELSSPVLKPLLLALASRWVQQETRFCASVIEEIA